MTPLNGKADAIISVMEKNGVEYSVSGTFSRLTTFGCGGKIALTLFPDTAAKLVFCLKTLSDAAAEYTVVGMGSNIIASDKFYDGAVIVTKKLSGISVCGDTVRCLAGTSCVRLSRKLAEEGLKGGEFLACLPATVGGATVMNAGCFGGCMADIVRGVTVYDGKELLKLSSDQCGFGKRTAIFSRKGLIVIGTEMKFSRGDALEISAATEKLRAKKAAEQPLDARSAGCVFFHETEAVSRMIDKAGLKGFRIGGAEVSEKHAGFLINVDKASSRDIYLLIRHVENVLKEKYALTPRLEVKLVNFQEDGVPFPL